MALVTFAAGLTCYLEGGTAGSATSSFLLHHGAQLAAVKVRVDHFAGWEGLIMNEVAATPSNTEHKLLVLVTLRFDLGSPIPSVH